MQQPGLSIGDLARTTGAKVETIRYYERRGVLAAPNRTAANDRTRGKAHLARPSFIRRCRELGSPLERVEALLRLSDRPGGLLVEAHRIARRRLGAIGRKTADRQSRRRELTDLVRKFRGRAAVPDCRTIEALAPHG
jgi:DNA-binding transcriptional MerR regulator